MKIRFKCGSRSFDLRLFNVYPPHSALPKNVPSRPLITNLTCPGDSSLYIEWSPPEVFYHGVDSYKLYMKTREQQHWQLREILVPPVAKHHVEKVRLQI